MSTTVEKPLEGEINIDVVTKCLKTLEDSLDVGLKSGVFKLKDAHTLYECYFAVTKTVEQCDLLQKKMKHLLRQQDLIRQAENTTL